MTDAPDPNAPLIEGGIDALVIGANTDGLIAAAMLARAGLHTVLIDTEASENGVTDRGRREFAPGYISQGGDPLSISLDPGVIQKLDLYRHGLAYAQRRMETLYRFQDGASVVVSGEFSCSHEQISAFSPSDAESYKNLHHAIVPEMTRRVDQAGRGDEALAFDDEIAGLFDDERLEDMLRAEALIGAAARSNEPFSFEALYDRYAGETAGLRGAVGFIEGGEMGLVDALRRAAQSAGVRIKASGQVASVIVEWDHVAGVQLVSGGQLRAPVVVSALPAQTAFIEHIGRDRLDIEFVRYLEQPRPSIAYACVDLALGAAPLDSQLSADLRRRIVIAPRDIDLHSAWRRAREGGAQSPLLAELVFPSAFDATLAPEGRLTAHALVHPVPFTEDKNETWAELVSSTVSKTLDLLSPELSEQVKAASTYSVSRALPPVLAAQERAAIVKTCSGLDGYYFCGEEAHINRYRTGVPGRDAATAALSYFSGKDGSS